jgi:HEAT repeat protein
LHDLLAARALENTFEAVNAGNAALPDSSRALLVRALGETGRREAFGPLRVALCHPAGQVRTAAAGALGALGFAAAKDALVRAARDPDWRVRLKAVESIVKLGLGGCGDCLLTLCSDPVWWVRFRAEEALRNLADAGVADLWEVQGHRSVAEARSSLRVSR